MKFYSTNKQTNAVSLREAVFNGLAPDEGLYMPSFVPVMENEFFERLNLLTYSEIAYAISELFFGEDIPKNDLETIIEKSTTFDAPLIKLSEKIYSLELFHGPTLSFKDFGICFMARLMAYFIRQDQSELTLLAATSGDTGSAVGKAFVNIPGIKAWLLYPKGQISYIQEKQMTTIGNNVKAIEVVGSFDDCQNLVKKAFCDFELRKKLNLTSGNSMNIARLIPQIFYYFFGYAQLHNEERKNIVFSVPSGNFGNLTAGIFAKKLGLPIKQLIASTNINDVVPKYLKTGIFKPQISKRTISNAMDVGNPSNFVRILDFYEGDYNRICHDITSFSFDDHQNKEGLLELYQRFSYIADPHGAIGYLGLKEYLKTNSTIKGIFLETAHPAKFQEIIENILKRAIDTPDTLQLALGQKKNTIEINADYGDFKELLLSMK